MSPSLALQFLLIFTVAAIGVKGQDEKQGDNGEKLDQISIATETTVSTTTVETSSVNEAVNESSSTTTTTTTTAEPSETPTIPALSAQGDVVTTVTDPSEAGVKDDMFYVRRGSKTCILLELDANFMLNYPKQTETLSFTLPDADSINVSGSCGGSGKPPEIALKWENYILSFTFNKDGRLWCVQSIALEFSPSKVFKDNNQGNQARSVSRLQKTFLGARLNMSYSCDSSEQVPLYEGATGGGAVSAYVILKRIRMEAFPPRLSFSMESPCGSHVVQPLLPEYSERSDTLPVAVGSFLAVAALLTVAGYGVYRSLTVKKVDYDTMDE